MKNVEIASISFKNQFLRLIWSFSYILFFRFTLRNAFAWRRIILKIFGAKLDTGAKIYATSRIWAPWNLEMGEDSVMGDYVNCYNVSHIRIGRKSIISQYSYLCTATHDFDVEEHNLMVAPIEIQDDAWVSADCFIAPGTCIGFGSVVLARSTVLEDTDPWWVYGGYPAKAKRKRGWKRNHGEKVEK